MAAKPEMPESRIVSAEQETRRAQKIKEKITAMKKMFTTALLSAVAVPFLVAAPAPKAQNTAAGSTMESGTAKTKVKKHHKKHSTSATESSTTSTSATK